MPSEPRTAKKPPVSSLRPIVVIGFPRSGAMALADYLRDALGLPEETLPGGFSLQTALLDEIAGQYERLDDEYLARKDAHLIANTDEHALSEIVTSWFDERWNASANDGRWVAPYLITEPDFRLRERLTRMVEVFPEARFVFVARPGVETMLSTQRHDPQVPVGHVMRHWGVATSLGSEVFSTIPGRTLLVTQTAMALRPAATVQSLKDFLSLSDAESQLLQERLTGPRRRQTGVPSEQHALTPDFAGWAEPLKQHFARVAEPGLVALGDADLSIEGAAPTARLFAHEGHASLTEDADGWLSFEVKDVQPVDLPYRMQPLVGMTKAVLETAASGTGKAAIVIRAGAQGGDDVVWRNDVDLATALTEDRPIPPLERCMDLTLRLVPDATAVGQTLRLRVTFLPA